MKKYLLPNLPAILAIILATLSLAKTIIEHEPAGFPPAIHDTSRIQTYDNAR